MVPLLPMSKPGYLNFLVEEKDRERLEAVAQQKGYTLSEMARKCLRAGLRLASDFPPRDTSASVRTSRRVAA